MSHMWGTKEWFESMFSDSGDYDKWGHQWRGSQKFRYGLYMKVLKNILSTRKKMKILDIGCGLGDFTKRIWGLNQKNEIVGIDISENAIKKATKKNSNIDFIVGALPNLPFSEDIFDLVLCLEVLYYLKPKDRVSAIINIKRVLKPDGYLLISGVLDGGIRYFAENEIVNLISKYFDIVKIEYNYGKIYTIVESKLLRILNICDIISEILNMNDKEFSEWYSAVSNKQKAKKVKKIRQITNELPFVLKLTKITLNAIKSVIKKVLSIKFFVIICYSISKYLLKERDRTQIIILAKNTNEVK